jgi:hypothetical protein
MNSWMNVLTATNTVKKYNLLFTESEKSMDWSIYIIVEICNL